MRYLMRRARRRGAEVVVVVHNHKPHEPVPFWRVLTRTTLGQADRLVALSAFVGDRLGELVPGVPVQVVGLPPYFDSSPSDGAQLWRRRLDGVYGPVILFFGNVRAYKGLADLVAAMPRIRQRSRATLVVAGTFFEPLERFRHQAERLGVADSVRFFPDYVPNEQVPGLFELADVVALPYRSASQSGILPQAAAAGKPVVATAVGALPETIGENGVLVAPRDPISLADGLVRALERPPPPPALSDDPWRPWVEMLR
jgi:glycosyltransferase involved in cell wall biosynthesis